MIRQPPEGSRNVSDSFYKAESQRIAELNEKFFSDVELTDAENKILVWLCSWDNFTILNVISVFEKAVKKVGEK